MILLQETANSLANKGSEDFLSNPPCGCHHPGKEIKCEDCPFLEASLSRCKTGKTLSIKTK